MKTIHTTEVSFPGNISGLARDWVQRALVIDAAQRATVPELLAHPWITTNTKTQMVRSDSSMVGSSSRSAQDTSSMPENRGHMARHSTLHYVRPLMPCLLWAARCAPALVVSLLRVSTTAHAEFPLLYSASLVRFLLYRMDPRGASIGQVTVMRPLLDAVRRQGCRQQLPHLRSMTARSVQKSLALLPPHQHTPVPQAPLSGTYRPSTLPGLRCSAASEIAMARERRASAVSSSSPNACTLVGELPQGAVFGSMAVLPMERLVKPCTPSLLGFTM